MKLFSNLFKKVIFTNKKVLTNKKHLGWAKPILLLKLYYWSIAKKFDIKKGPMRDSKLNQ